MPYSMAAEERQRAHYMTSCQILSCIPTAEVRKQCLGAIQQARKHSCIPDIAKAPFKPQVNRILDCFAFLLVRRGGSDSVAVCMEGLTKDTISLICSTDQYTSQDPKRIKRDFRAMQKHAQELYGLLQRAMIDEADKEDDSDTLVDMVIAQIKYSMHKVSSRWRQTYEEIKSLDRKLIYSEDCPLWADFNTIPNEWSDLYVPILPKSRERGHLYMELIAQAVEEERVEDFKDIRELLSRIWEKNTSMEINETNFDDWTTLFVWIFREFDKSFTALEEATKSNDEEKVETFVHRVRIWMYVIYWLGHASNTFRRWIAVATQYRDRVAAKIERTSSGTGAPKAENLQPKDSRESVRSPDEPTEAQKYQSGTKRIAKGIRSFFKGIRGGLSPGLADTDINSETESSTRVPNTPGELLPSTQVEDQDGRLPEGISTTDDQMELKTPAASSKGDQESIEDELVPQLDASDRALGPLTANNAAFRKVWLMSEIVHSFQEILLSPYLRKIARGRRLRLTMALVSPLQEEKSTFKSLGDCVQHHLGLSSEPSNEEDIQKLVTKLIQTAPREDQRKKLEALDTQSDLKGPVREHAELIVWQWLANQNPNEIYPYVGTSKPPCFACEYIISRQIDIGMRVGIGQVCVSMIPREVHFWTQDKIHDVVKALTSAVLSRLLEVGPRPRPMDCEASDVGQSGERDFMLEYDDVSALGRG